MNWTRPWAVIPGAALLIALVIDQPLAAGEDEDAAIWKRCYEAVPWLYSADVPDTEREMMDLVSRGALAAHRRRWIRAAITGGPTIEECLEKAAAQRKLLLWYVPTVEGQHNVLPHLLDRYMMVGPFSHPDVVALLERRFVSIRLPGGGDLAKTYALTSPDFLEPGLLIFHPDGRMVHRMDRISTFNPEYFLHLFVTLLDRHRDALTVSPALGEARSRASASQNDVAVRIAWAAQAMLDGEYGEAERALERIGKPGAVLRARLAIRRRRGVEALKHLDGVDAVERGIVHLREGRFEESIRVLAGVEQPGAESAYHLGLACYLARREEEAEKAFRLAISLDPGSLWAMKASACAVAGSDGRRGESSLTRSMSDARWMAPEVYRLARDTQWRRTPDHLEDIRRRALDFLLTQQRSDGSWPGFRWGRPAEGKGHNRNVDLAIAALGCAALHAWRSEAPRRVDEALARGEARLLDRSVVRRGDAVAWVYADVYRLVHFARRLPALEGKRKGEVRRAMRVWIESLIAHQKENDGCFKHYVYRSTFVTAGVASGLHEVRAAGFDLPDVVFSKAADLLEGARGDNGLFGYLLDRPAVTRSPLGAAARQPLCVLTLFQCGRATERDLDRAVRLYREVYDRSTERARKANFHIPVLDQTAGYYFFHDFVAACEAARQSGENAEEHMRALEELLCALPEIDGSFIDCGFSYGKSYSTAMALLAMRILSSPGD